MQEGTTNPHPRSSKSSHQQDTEGQRRMTTASSYTTAAAQHTTTPQPLRSTSANTVAEPGTPKATRPSQPGKPGRRQTPTEETAKQASPPDQNPIPPAQTEGGGETMAIQTRHKATKASPKLAKQASAYRRHKDHQHHTGRSTQASGDPHPQATHVHSIHGRRPPFHQRKSV